MAVLIQIPLGHILADVCCTASIVGMTADVKGVSKTQVVPIVYIRDVPEELHRRIRVAAATTGESMRALALRALEREVERLEVEERKRRTANE
jgi:hypothetical protein